MNPRSSIVIAVSILLSGCATPHVVKTTQMEDQNMTCNQLELEISEADRFRAEAQKEKGVTGTNVAAAILFWPGLIATHLNSNEAVAAADIRNRNLMNIYNQKNCSSQAPVGQHSVKGVEERLANLKVMLEKGLISGQEYEDKRKSIINSF